MENSKLQISSRSERQYKGNEERRVWELECQVTEDIGCHGGKGFKIESERDGSHWKVWEQGGVNMTESVFECTGTCWKKASLAAGKLWGCALP